MKVIRLVSSAALPHINVLMPEHDLTQLDYDKHLEERALQDRRQEFRRLNSGGFQRRKPRPVYASDVEDM